jgi:hypothetical protein
VGLTIIGWYYLFSTLSLGGSGCRRYEDVPGKVLVSFENKTYAEAIAIVSQQGLSYSDTYGETLRFSPDVFATGHAFRPEVTEQRLKARTEVKAVEALMIEEGEQKGKVSLTISFKQDTSKTRIEQILKEENITIDNYFSNAGLRAHVPVGREKEYVKKLKEQSGVLSAEQETKCVEQGDD